VSQPPSTFGARRVDVIGDEDVHQCYRNRVVFTLSGYEVQPFQKNGGYASRSPRSQREKSRA
jgi:hypothetical protein